MEELEFAFRYKVDQQIRDCDKEVNPAEKSYNGVFNERINPKLPK